MNKQLELCILQGLPASGKGQPEESKILTPNGWELMLNIQVGDIILNPDGSKQTVDYKKYNGQKKIYKFTFNDGATCLADEDHLWRLSSQKQVKKDINKYYHLWTTKEIIEKDWIYNYRGKRKSKYQILLPKIVFPEQKHIIPPYILGVLLANGHLKRTISYTTNKKSIADKIESLINHPYIKQVERTYENSTSRNWCLNRIQGTPKNNVWIKELKRLNLFNKLSQEKFIPKEYLFDSQQNRVELLKGLMDCDGTISSRSAKYSSKSKQLIKNVQELVRSLGGSSTLNKHQHKTGSYWTTTVDVSFNPFTRKDYSKKWNSKNKRRVSRQLRNIELVKTAETWCISVSNSNGLYITDDYIVTHNSTYARKWVNEDPKNRVRVNRDDIRRMLGPYWVPQREKLVTTIENNMIGSSLSKGYDVIVDSTNLRGTQRFQHAAEYYDAELTKQTFLDISIDVLKIRDNNREYPVGEDVIDKMANKYELI